jgi:hypothetical protein
MLSEDTQLSEGTKKSTFKLPQRRDASRRREKMEDTHVDFLRELNSAFLSHHEFAKRVRNLLFPKLL